VITVWSLDLDPDTEIFLIKNITLFSYQNTANWRTTKATVLLIALRREKKENVSERGNRQIVLLLRGV
jgi:hypothetical protein